MLFKCWNDFKILAYLAYFEVHKLHPWKHKLPTNLLSHKIAPWGAISPRLNTIDPVACREGGERGGSPGIQGKAASKQ